MTSIGDFVPIRDFLSPPSGRGLIFGEICFSVVYFTKKLFFFQTFFFLEKQKSIVSEPKLVFVVKKKLSKEK